AKHGSTLRPGPDRDDVRLTRLLAPADSAARAYVGRVIGVSTAEWSGRTARLEDTPLLDFVNEVERRVTGADLASTAAFTLDAHISRGPVTVAQIAGLYVYDNTLEAVKISGAQLRAYLEKSAEYYLTCTPPNCERVANPAIPGYNFDAVSGVDYTLDLTRPVGERVVRLERNGVAVQPTDSFTLALNNYRASGSGGYSMLAGAPVVYDRGESIRDLLIAEVERRDTLSPEDYFHENWEIVPAKPSQQSGKHLRVVATNDFHGALLPSRPGFAKGREVGGAAALLAYFDSARAEGGATVLIDAGDVMQGTPLSNLTNGRASVDFYNRAGYAAAALGNHEFDWGIDTLRARVAQARFAWLGANVFVKGTDTLPSWVEPTRMVTLAGCAAGAPACDSVRVGIVGIATEQTPTTTRPSNVTSLTFGDEAAAVDRWVPRLRAAGADFVVVTAHSGGFCDRDDPSRGCKGEIFDVARRLTTHPDLIVSGHTHSQVNTVVNGIPIVQANANGTRFSVVELNRVSPDSVAVRVEQPTTFTDRVRPDSAEAAAIARYEKEIGPRVNEVIARLAVPLPREGAEYALGDLIADAQRAATGTQVAIMNNGGIRTSLEAGPVSYADLFRLQPFANTLVTMELTGAQLRATVEHAIERGEPDAHFSGLRVRYDPDAPTGSRIVSLTLADGAPVVPGGHYSVTVNDFMAEGGDGYAELPHGSKVERTGSVDLDALIAYLRRQPQPLQPPTPDRVTPVR
ncbi:MAG TPA: 5'-nucleotidase C-terminal domain-containing protein, partial [Longimicrobiaceae bacterium]|nr:5'-nucleotidase C-terminal domain-containing protein [Longimicrobiaceae bacterium]